ncbi:MAG: TetR/AcrR family transcriptional regulator [Dongiaceae bacterium]
MSPRRYQMSKRQYAAEDTRRRIVEATVVLHTEKGIFGTSWQDIARKADVSIGTVYKHFPSLDDLVPACGAMLMERTRPPAPEDGPRIVGDSLGHEARLRQVAEELFAFYERAGGSLRLDARERKLPAVREWESYLQSTVATLVKFALKPDRSDMAAIRFVGALLDPATYDAMRMRGIKPNRAAQAVAAMAATWYANERHDDPGRPGAPAAVSRKKRHRPGTR